jgi:hypothetical protein
MARPASTLRVCSAASASAVRSLHTAAAASGGACFLAAQRIDHPPFSDTITLNNHAQPPTTSIFVDVQN